MISYLHGSNRYLDTYLWILCFYGSVLLAGLCSQARCVNKQGPGGFHMFVLNVASWFTILVRWVIYTY